jgi:hypothetical protein
VSRAIMSWDRWEHRQRARALEIGLERQRAPSEHGVRAGEP